MDIVDLLLADSNSFEQSEREARVVLAALLKEAARVIQDLRYEINELDERYDRLRRACDEGF